MLEAIGLALGGRAGARLAAAAGIAAGRTTLLRLVRALPEPVLATPVVLGIDDFALRRGTSYATVLADMVTRRPVDLLAGRHAKVVEDWLAAHPGVQVICRDRASAYAEGARAGAPDAVQVADRWHLWQNLTEAAEKCVIQHQACLREPDGPAPPIQAPEAGAPTGLVTRIRERYAAVQELTANGTGYRPAARQLGLGLNTVKRYARAASVEELLESAARPSNLVPRQATFARVTRRPRPRRLRHGNADALGVARREPACRSVWRDPPHEPGTAPPLMAGSAG